MLDFLSVFSSTNSIQLIHLQEEGNYAVYSTDGKLIVQASAVSKLSFDQRGMFLLVNEAKGLVERIVVN